MKLSSLLKTAAAALAAVMMSSAAYAQTVVVGSKDFAEQILLAEMTAQLLRSKGYEVDLREGMGSSVVREAQLNGQVDLYWEYTGTSLVTYNKVDEKLNAEETYARVKELDAAQGLTWLAPSAANNTYALAVRGSDEKTDGINTLSDLAAKYNDGESLLMAVNAEFPQRPDGLVGLKETYGFDVGRADLRPMDSGLTYQALNEDQVDVALVFATDGRVGAFSFRVLEDDQGFFPDYAIVPVIRTEVLEANPELQPVLESLSAVLDDGTMQDLNGQVAVEQKTIQDVATTFLTEKGLI
jgi:osmoprotectant transport system substrate-binding protein